MDASDTVLMSNYMIERFYMKRFPGLLTITGFLVLTGLAVLVTGCASSSSDTANKTTANNEPAAAVPSNSNSTTQPVATAADNQGKQNQQTTKGPQPIIGSGASDFGIFTAARAAIISNSELQDSNVIINVSAGVVTLTGTVNTPAQKVTVEKVVREINGVKGVKNQLTLTKAS
jgi:hyperosmotically inducible protein